MKRLSFSLYNSLFWFRVGLKLFLVLYNRPHIFIHHLVNLLLVITFLWKFFNIITIFFIYYLQKYQLKNTFLWVSYKKLSFSLTRGCYSQTTWRLCVTLFGRSLWFYHLEFYEKPFHLQERKCQYRWRVLNFKWI